MHPQLHEVFHHLGAYTIGIIGSALRDFESAKDIDILFLTTGAFEHACGENGITWNGWDAHNGHLRRGNGRLEGVEKPVQFLHIGSVTKFEDHPHSVLLRNGAILKPGVHYHKPEWWKYDKIITVDRRKQMNSKTVAIDFDGTIRSWDTSQPIEGAREAIMLFREHGYKVLVHTCNRKEWVEQWLNEHDIRYDGIWDGKGKPICSLYADDRGYKFCGDWTHEQLEILKILEKDG